MKKLLLIFSDGTEEIEGITPIDLLRRCGVQCDIASLNSLFPVGSHGITVKADILINNANIDDYDGIIIPGGMPGAANISDNKRAVSLIKQAFRDGKLVASICASPAVVLAKNSLIDGRQATCFPSDGFIKLMNNASYNAEHVVTDGNLITADGPKSAMDFSLAVCRYFGLTPTL